MPRPPFAAWSEIQNRTVDLVLQIGWQSLQPVTNTKVIVAGIVAVELGQGATSCTSEAMNARGLGPG